MKNLIIALLVTCLAVTGVAQTAAPKAAPKATRASLTVDSIKSSLGVYDIGTNITAQQVNALATTAAPAATAAWQSITNSPEWAAYPIDSKTSAEWNYKTWLDVCSAAKAVVDNKPYDLTGTFHANPYTFAYGRASSLFLFTKEYSYVDGWITNNVDRITVSAISSYGMSFQHESVKITDLASAKRVFVHNLAFVFAQSKGVITTVVDLAKRMEIMERRAAGLTVIGKDALPKTAALTAAINTGEGLKEALQGFVGNDLPSLDVAIAKKRTFAQTLKDQINSGLRDAVALDVEYIGSWLGVAPTAAWVKQYNGQ